MTQNATTEPMTGVVMQPVKEPSMYPQNDDQHEEHSIAEVRGDSSNGWHINRADGWSFYVPPESPVAPATGMMARFYGRGVGFSVRGLFLDGQQVFYRTAEQDEAHRLTELYGADAADWLSRWDAGRSVWSIEMGGIGPGYEQCIQITAAEILRHLLDKKYDSSRWIDSKAWKADCDAIEAACLSLEGLRKLGLSGGQWGAGLRIATSLYKWGPQKLMADVSKERHIQVCRVFPAA